MKYLLILIENLWQQYIKYGDKYRIITKGAVDVLLNRCIKIYKDGEIRNLDNIDKETILNKNSDMADKALRVIAVCYVDKETLPRKLDETLEQNLIFVRTNSVW